jgi:GxxExxY protein
MFVGKHANLTEKIIGAFYKVYRTLGYGFLENVYESALVLELRELGLQVEQQKRITVYYNDQVVGEYQADIVVNSAVIFELKAARQLLKEHEAQLLNYLKATRIEVGLLLNFGPEAKFKRKVYDNDRKGSLAWVDRQS